MSTQPIDLPRPLPDWMYPPGGEDGWTAEGFLSLADELPPHIELIDGALVIDMSPQRAFHSLTLRLLENALADAAPADRWVRREMSSVLDVDQVPEPDLLVLHGEFTETADTISYPAANILLAVEVVSPSSVKRDRVRKPQIYAEAGIRHFWRVECDERGLPVVFVYELDGKRYTPTGIFHDRLTLAVPYAIDIDISKLPR